MSHDDFAFEPQPGLPAALPVGERLLWQGTPDWRALAVRAYHVRKVGIYFGVLAAWRIAVGLHEAHTIAAIAVSCLFLATLAAAAAGLLALLAYLNARSTVYTITSKRVLLRHGVAVPLTMNLPLRQIEGAALRTFADGTGDIALKLPAEQRLGYLVTWPHLRPGRFTHPEPSLRALRDGAAAAQLLGAAVAADGNVAEDMVGASGTQRAATPPSGGRVAAAA